MRILVDLNAEVHETAVVDRMLRCLWIEMLRGRHMLRKGMMSLNLRDENRAMKERL